MTQVLSTIANPITSTPTPAPPKALPQNQRQGNQPNSSHNVRRNYGLSNPLLLLCPIRLLNRPTHDQVVLHVHQNRAYETTERDNFKYIHRPQKKRSGRNQTRSGDAGNGHNFRRRINPHAPRSSQTITVTRSTLFNYCTAYDSLYFSSNATLFLLFFLGIKETNRNAHTAWGCLRINCVCRSVRQDNTTLPVSCCFPRLNE